MDLNYYSKGRARSLGTFNWTRLVVLSQLSLVSSSVGTWCGIIVSVFGRFCWCWEIIKEEDKLNQHYLSRYYYWMGLTFHCIKKTNGKSLNTFYFLKSLFSIIFLKNFSALFLRFPYIRLFLTFYSREVFHYILSCCSTILCCSVI